MIFPERKRSNHAVTAQEAHKRLEFYIKNRGDIGVFKRFKELVLNPRNPFDDKARRSPKAEVLLFGLIAVLLLVCIFYFNFF